MTTTTDDVWVKLRKPFPAEQIGHLPRGGTQLDYVGHADVTSRLIEADPAWSWEPLASDENGLPRFDLDDKGRPVGLWIKLTVGGVTRLGYGSCPSGQGDAVKVLIGDALRNSAMRFGVALDLWAKGDRADPSAENPSGAAGHARRGGQSAADAFENARPAPAPRRAERMPSVPADDPWYGDPPPDANGGEAAQPAPAAPKAAQPRPRVTREAAAESDQVWLDLIHQEIEQIKTRADGNSAWAHIAKAYNEGSCTAADRKALEALTAGKISEVIEQEPPKEGAA